MRPTLTTGDLLSIRSVPIGEIQVGDVIAAIADDGSPFAHRVIRIERNRIWTRGDGARSTDPPVEHAHVMGIVERGGRAGRAIVRWPALAPLVGALVRSDDLAVVGRTLLEALAVRLRRALRA